MIVKQTFPLILSAFMFLLAPFNQEAITLLEATPPPQSTITEPIEQITMRFSGAVENGTFEVRRSDGTTLPPRAVIISGVEVTLLYPAGLPAGGYEVTWGVTGPQQTLGEGVFSFTLRLPATTLQFISPQDGQTLPPGPLTLDVALQGQDLTTEGLQVAFTIDDQTLNASILPTQTEPLTPGIYTISAVLIQGETALETTRQQVTVVVAEPTPIPENPAAATQVEPTTGAAALASVVGVVILLAVGLFLGSRSRPPS